MSLGDASDLLSYSWTRKCGRDGLELAFPDGRTLYRGSWLVSIRTSTELLVFPSLFRDLSPDPLGVSYCRAACSIAYRVSSASECASSLSIRFARWVSTVRFPMSSSSAISLFVIPSASNWSTSRSLLVSES